MDPIERAYRAEIGSWTGVQRVARSMALLEEVSGMLERKIRRARPEFDDRQVQIEVAKCLYRTDPTTQELLRLAEAHHAEEKRIQARRSHDAG